MTIPVWSPSLSVTTPAGTVYDVPVTTVMVRFALLRSTVITGMIVTQPEIVRISSSAHDIKLAIWKICILLLPESTTKRWVLFVAIAVGLSNSPLVEPEPSNFAR